jgi:transcriptional regulator with XRE-family HTH domain
MELLRRREATGMSREEVARQLEWSTSTLFRIETGRSRPQPGNVRTLLELYGVTGAERDGLIQLTREARQPGWWHSFRDVLPNPYEVYIGLEAGRADGRAQLERAVVRSAHEYAPDAFERLAQRLLREADFDSVKVTGQSGDGGIDGLGVYRLGLMSFPVFFQAKRYRGSVGSGAVRDFRGAMAGRGDKGLLITTGSFTAEAKKEATRDGVPPIDLIDGDLLCELLKKYDLGVQTATRTVEDVTIDGPSSTKSDADGP